MPKKKIDQCLAKAGKRTAALMIAFYVSISAASVPFLYWFIGLPYFEIERGTIYVIMIVTFLYFFIYRNLVVFLLAITRNRCVLYTANGLLIFDLAFLWRLKLAEISSVAVEGNFIAFRTISGKRKLILASALNENPGDVVSKFQALLKA